jgi:hypothetical protein
MSGNAVAKVEGSMTDQAEGSKALIRQITDETWNQGRLELADDATSDDVSTVSNLPEWRECGHPGSDRTLSVSTAP